MKRSEIYSQGCRMGSHSNQPERRNAMSGNMRDFIDYLAINNKVFRVVSKENKRFLYADWVAHVVCLELSKGSTQVKAQDLQNMYIQYKDFDKNSTLAKKVKLYAKLHGRCI